MQKKITFGGKQIYYKVVGNGKPVMLVHGFGEDGDIFNNQVEYLKNHFQLIVPDLPGSGLSEVIEDMSIDGMAEVIYSIILEENVDACPVIGHSMGGYITLALMEKHGYHMNGFCLFHSSAFADTKEKIITRKKSIAFIKENGAFEFLKTAIPNLFAEASKTIYSTKIKELIAKGNNFLTQSLVSYYEAMISRPDRTEILRKTTVPVLFIMGEFDNAVPIKDSLQQSHLPEKSYIHILKNSGHMGMIEEAELCNQILEKFLRDI